MVAHQVMGKAARDAFFLTSFDAAWLPVMKIAAAVFAMGIGLALPPVFRRFGLSRAAPGAFVVSGLAHMLEFALRTVSPEAVAVLVYLHIVGLCAILLSSFWLLMSERFDPAGARQWFGRIAGYGTLGGVAGGVVTERWAAAGHSGLTLLLLMGVLQIVAGLCLLAQAGEARAEGEPQAPPLSARAALASAPYLRLLAWMVFLGTSAAALIDLWFATTAKQALGGGAPLLRFFAAFHTSTQALVFLMQAFVVRAMLDRHGLGRAVASLPVTVIAGVGAAVALPGLAGAALARGAEYVVRGSLFRSGYEAFYSPVPPAEKRAAKSLIDVVCDRMGDAAGGLVFQALLRTGVVPLALPVAAVVALANYWLARRLDRSYSEVVHRGLTDRAQLVNEHLSQYGDWSLDSVVVDIPRLAKPAPGASATVGLDETTRRLAALRSGDEALVKRTLAALRRLDPVLAPAVVELLAWRAVLSEARQALEAAGERHVGLLVDWLLDPATDFNIRRRLPGVLAGIGGRRAMAGLADGLGDARFEVRLECARGLARAGAAERAPVLSPERLHEALERELSVAPPVWRSRSVGEEGEGGRIEMLFALLALLHGRETLKVAYQALQAKDRVVQALSVEYVDSLLPAALRPKWRALMAEGGLAAAASRSAAEVEAMLLASGIRVESEQE